MKKTRIIGIEHAPLLEKLHGVLWDEPDGVKQQIAIELMMASHAIRMGEMSDMVLDAMCKHAKQISREWK